MNFTGKEDFLPPFINIVSNYFIAEKYKLGMCIVRKSMAQLTINTMCYLYDSKLFLKMNQTMNDKKGVTERECRKNDEFTQLSDQLDNDPDFTRIVYVREPFDRFLSFFLDKCVNEDRCWDCKEDMRCVVEKLYQSLRKFLVHKDSKLNYMDYHAAPISWNCQFDKHLSKYNILMIGPEKDERRAAIYQLGNILKSKNVPQHEIDYIIYNSLGGLTTHSTHFSEKRINAQKQIETDPFIRDYLHKIYFYDYQIFPFSKSALDEKYRNYNPKDLLL
ncbi:unnamed protein product [Caenorhabditis bovis]|uniref:Carbohydrate sulfotransferase n=1 Tax=Caenorhabditis bovis TaxID=2654633 RepID=A0A8S1F4C7_9PELO|nr:unnamed protein product [Caenorhabditis bovis]